MPDRLEFLSPDWFAALRQIVKEGASAAAADLAGADFTICEVFTHCPPGDRTVAHFIRFAGGAVEFGDEAVAGADVLLTVAHDVVLPVARTVFSDPDGLARAQAAIAAATAAGTWRAEGDMATAPPAVQAVLGRVHDTIAAMTA